MKKVIIDLNADQARFNIGNRSCLIADIYPKKKEVDFRLKFDTADAGLVEVANFVYKYYTLKDSIISISGKDEVISVIDNVIKNRNHIVDYMEVTNRLYLRESVRPINLTAVTAMFIDWLDVKKKDLISNSINDV